MNFAKFLTFLALKQNVKTRENVLYQTHHDYDHTNKDPHAYYTLTRMIIEDSFMKAQIIYSRDTSNDKMSWKLINVDIFHSGWPENNNDKLFIKNAKLTDLISHFIEDAK